MFQTHSGDGGAFQIRLLTTHSVCSGAQLDGECVFAYCIREKRLSPFSVSNDLPIPGSRCRVRTAVVEKWTGLPLLFRGQ
jgi:hypothetical protein